MLAPLLYFAAAAAVVAAVRVPRRAAAALVLLPLCVTGPAILTGRVYAPVDIAYTSEPLASIAREMGVGAVANPAVSDVYAQFIPWHDAVRYAIAHRQWPLWNPFELCGGPLAGAVQSAPYHPIHLLAYLLPLPDALTFIATMVLFLAALSAFLLLRDLVDSEWAAIIGAAAWMASTHLRTFLGTAHGMGVAVFPLLLFAARRVARAPSLRSGALLIGALLLLVFAGHPETMLHGVALAVAYFAFEKGLNRRSMAIGLAAGIAALLLSAFFLLPFAEAVPQTAEYRFRTARRYPQQRMIARRGQVAHAVAVEAMPYLDGLSGFEAREHALPIRHSAAGSAYVGAILFAPALLALWRGRGRERWFFAALVAWGLLAGANAPGVTHLLHRLPGFAIAVNDRMVVFAALAIVVLAALGLDCHPERSRGTWAGGGTNVAPHPPRSLDYARDDRLELAAIYAVLAPLILAAVALLYPSLIRDGLTAGFIRVSAMRQIVPMLLAAAGLIVFRGRMVPALVLALLLVQRGGELSRRPIVERRAVYPPFPGLEVLPRGGEPYRIVGTGTGLPPNIATHYRLEDARGFQAMTFDRLEETFGMWSTRQSIWSNRVDDLGAPMLSLMNVRYAVASTSTPLPEGWEWRARTQDYGIAENTRALPRAFVPALIHGQADRGRTLQSLQLARDFRAEGWVEGGGDGTTANGPGVVTTRADGTRLRLHASMMGAGWVIVTVGAWRGWRATIDGKRAPVRIGDHAFLAVYVPQGEHNIKLVYRPQAFVIGAWISAISAVVLLAMMIALRGRARP